MQTGPSPRAWGLRFFLFRPFANGRSIPTCVGFTNTLTAPNIPCTVHPHVRGVYLNHFNSSLTASGPSPRAWGLLHSPPVKRSKYRSIPTCVGFTTSAVKAGTPMTVHPHVRGVYTEIKSKISRVSIKTALLPAEKFKILFLVKIKGSAAAFLDHTIFRDQSPPGLHFEIALHL